MDGLGQTESSGVLQEDCQEERMSMKAVLLLFDSLNRRFLPNYGCDWTKMPNFKRLGEKTLTFDSCYGGSMPCIPARRELHTGRYNFLHRSWSPMEPYDESVITNLREAGVYTHIVTDHFHYWEDGGSGYLTKFDSHEMIRGQQGDPWIGQVKWPDCPETLCHRPTTRRENWRHDWVNRSFLSDEEKMPQAQTFARGLDFIERNWEEDRWFLQIEAFDPHEPFFTQDSYKQLYPETYTGKHLDWPDYGCNRYGQEATEHVRHEYAALLSMCDHYLGKLLDQFDEKDLWKDTMLIVATDHGFLLGEREMMGKNTMPWYDELIHNPLFVYDPRTPENRGQRRSALVQTIDIAPTLAAYFGAKPLSFADGKELSPVIREDAPVREAALFGTFGAHINITDGRYVYMRAPAELKNGPLYEYTLMPNHMLGPFRLSELTHMEIGEFPFTRGAKVMKLPATQTPNPYWFGNRLYDLENDPRQQTPLEDRDTELRLLRLMRDLMVQNDAPAEQFVRIGIPQTGEVTWENIQSCGEKPVDLVGEPASRLTPKGRKAMNIFLSMQTPEKQAEIRREVLSAQLTDGELLDEEFVMTLLRKFLPPAGAYAQEQMLRTFLL